MSYNDDCTAAGMTDCDAYIAWRLGLKALEAARSVGAKFPSD